MGGGRRRGKRGNWIERVRGVIATLREREKNLCERGSVENTD